MQIKCHKCNQLFIPDSDSKICPECRNEAIRWDRERKCIKCGKTYKPVARKQMYCSEKCYKAAKEKEKK